MLIFHAPIVYGLMFLVSFFNIFFCLSCLHFLSSSPNTGDREGVSGWKKRGNRRTDKEREEVERYGRQINRYELL